MEVSEDKLKEMTTTKISHDKYGYGYGPWADWQGGTTTTVYYTASAVKP